MFPTGYTFTGSLSEPAGSLFGLPHSLVNHAVVNGSHLGLHGLIAQLPQAHLQTLLHGPLRGMNIGLAFPMVGGTGSIHPQGLNMDVLTQLSSSNINPFMYVPTAVNQVSLPSNASDDSASAHTIVRAPVLYKTSINSDGEPVTSSTTKVDPKSTEQSPPDRIVASYAAAAHAAALACRQPISKAAEVFLAATSTGRSKHSKRPRNRATTTAAMEAFGVTTTVTNASTAPSIAVSSSSVSSPDKSSDGINKGWRRIVDRTANSVTYISQDGKKLQNMNEVFDYFGTQYPDFLVNKTYRELLMSCFSFEPTNEAPLFEEGLSFLGALQPSTQANGSVSSNNPVPSTNSTTNLVSSVSDHIPNSTHLTTSPNSEGPTSASVTCRISFNPNRVDSGDPNSAKRPRLVCNSPLHIDSGPDTSADLNVSEPPSNLPNVSPSSSTMTRAAISTVDPDEASTSLPKSDSESASAVLLIESDRFEDEVPATTMTQPQAATTSPVNSQYDSSVVSVGDTEGMIPKLASPVVTAATYFDRSAENSVAKLTTETVTTGALHANLPSSSLSVMPSVVSPAKQCTAQTNADPIAMALSNLMNSPAAVNLLALQANAEQSSLSNSIAMGQLINNARLVQLQQHHQQQQLAAAQINALSSNQLAGHPLAAALSSGALITPQALADLGHNNINNWVLAAQNIMDPSASVTPNNLAATATLQQLLLANALQSQQPINHQTALFAQAANLVQQQQQQQQQALAAHAQQQQQQALAAQAQQQQQLLSTSPFAQAYLAAVQQQLGNMSRW